MQTNNSRSGPARDHSQVTSQSVVSTSDRSSQNRVAIIAGVIVVVLLSAISLGLVLQGGAYSPSSWLPLMAATAALLLPISIAGPKITSNRAQKALLIVFGLQAIWTAASVLWADSLGNVWEEANRTLFYAITLGLTFTAIRWAGGAAVRALAVSVACLAGTVSVLVLVSLSTAADPLSLFVGPRLNYPVTYTNGLAALLMVGFWVALGLAGGFRSALRARANRIPYGDESTGLQVPVSRTIRRRPRDAGAGSTWKQSLAQSLLLVLAVVVLEVALLTQSRGAFFTFFVVLPFFVIFSPHRFRALANIAAVLLPMVLFWSRLNAPYLTISNREPVDPALQTLFVTVGYSVAVVVGIWAITWLVEYLIGSLRHRVAVWISVTLAALAVFGAAGGIVYTDIRTGGLDDRIGNWWHDMTATGDNDYINTDAGTRFVTGAGFGKRLEVWEVSVDAFVDHPLLGLGAQNFEAYWYQHRSMVFPAKQPHSQPLQLLAELGAPGALLWIVFIMGTIVYAARVRFREKRLADQAVLAAMITAVIYWFIHSSGEWLWQLVGVTLPAILLIGGLVGAQDIGTKPGESIGDSATENVPFPSGRRAGYSTRPRQVWIGRSVRALVVLLTLGVIASAVFPYLSSRYSALATSSPSQERAQARADTAKWLNPSSLEPYAAMAAVYRRAAATAPDATERFDQLGMLASTWQDALEVEPGNWGCHYAVAEALVAARAAALEVGLFSMTQELTNQARNHLEEARRLNPRSPEVTELEQSL